MCFSIRMSCVALVRLHCWAFSSRLTMIHVWLWTNCSVCYYFSFHSQKILKDLKRMIYATPTLEMKKRGMPVFIYIYIDRYARFRGDVKKEQWRSLRDWWYLPPASLFQKRKKGPSFFPVLLPLKNSFRETWSHEMKVSFFPYSFFYLHPTFIPRA